jgi:hypothetical protein
MIQFNRSFSFEYGHAHRLSPLVQRVVARNTGRFTWTGTGTILVGDDRDVAVIDPGPDREDPHRFPSSSLRRDYLTQLLRPNQHRQGLLELPVEPRFHVPPLPIVPVAGSARMVMSHQ